MLTQAREHLIRKTYEAIEGAKHVIVHLYTNISPMFQKAVYKTTRKGIVDIAVREIELLRMLDVYKRQGQGCFYATKTPASSGDSGC